MRRILVTNDDGIHAPGIQLMEKLARGLCEREGSGEVWVVAPETEQSGKSHSLSLADPIRIRQLEERRIALRGSPTDCVVLGNNSIMAEAKPTMILSGINRGANLADDLTYSGTCAAAMEGVILGIPAIAMSQCFSNREDVPWRTAEAHGPALLQALLVAELPREVFVNVNFPPCEPDQVKGVRVTRQGRRKLNQAVVTPRTDPRGFDYYWLNFKHDVGDAPADTDLGAVAAGYISVTPLHLDMTQHDWRDPLQERLDGALK
ncbi:5'/3'-nucleotidase SurE [Marinibaculum pumilum]|uniref:5'-nucleotidase SurE n=1 Tax=Marinibaculum pumilum TaxID=1766165 RepID=A0ABV7L0N1_9PROT